MEGLSTRPCGWSNFIFEGKARGLEGPPLADYYPLATGRYIGSIADSQRYFLKVVAVIATIHPSNAAQGNKTQLGFIEVGKER